MLENGPASGHPLRADLLKRYAATLRLSGNKKLAKRAEVQAARMQTAYPKPPAFEAVVDARNLAALPGKKR